MAEEVVCMKSRHRGIAASTVSGSTGSGGSVGNFAAGAMPNTNLRGLPNTTEGMGLLEKHPRDRHYAG